MPWRDVVGGLFVAAAWLAAIAYAVHNAYRIRLFAIETYGYVIHEFDPWFNFRATKYLADKGWHAFFHWFDRMSWYPLGRPVGTTIYPGMQITSVVLWRVLNTVRPFVLSAEQLKAAPEISLNDVCCLVPAWFGASATVLLSLLTGECSRSVSSSAFAGLIMAIVPAHLMRSVGGGYDNESVAITAMCATFLAWCRALRGREEDDWTVARRDAVLFGVLAGILYSYMVAVWGGFVFVLNVITVHAFVLVLLFRYTEKLRVAFSLFFVVGTAGATRVPVVGWRPLRDTEQLPALLAFLGLNLIGYVLKKKRYFQNRKKSFFKIALTAVLARLEAFIYLSILTGAAIAVLYPRGYFGPLSARIRGLFVKHTRTGNPLVDSVAEHQPASTAAYEQYLHHVYKLGPAGAVLSFIATRATDARVFLWTYALVVLYFCSKMARLIILLGPAASALGGVALGVPFDYFILHALGDLFKKRSVGTVTEDEKTEAAKKAPSTKSSEAPKGTKDSTATSKKGQDKPDDEPTKGRLLHKGLVSFISRISKKLVSFWRKWVWSSRLGAILRIAGGVYVIKTVLYPKALEFKDYAYHLSEGLSQPSIMFIGRTNNGEQVMVDDYRQAYLWLKKHTKKSARILAWWDYGYQITGIGERTTLADGNTWNHEHIATLGRILTAPEDEAWAIARHLADYVLVWAGGGGDDLAKSPHMARIGNSVYHDFCPDDPTCAHFGMYRGGRPTPSMAKSLLYKLTQAGLQPSVDLDPKRWKHAYNSKFGKVRIFKIMNVSMESKAWVANATNRLCDSEGSWYCPGQYPPAIKWLIDKRKPFRQLEDFNTGKRDEKADKYTQEYHKRMEETQSGRKQSSPSKSAKADKDQAKSLGFVGCYRLETQLPNDKVYAGGDTATSVAAAAAFAKRSKKQFFAIARVESDGHVFAFDALPSGDVITDAGCDRACIDEPNFQCGCADAGCPSSVKRQPDESYLRRWVVYGFTDGGGTATRKQPRRSASSSSSSKQSASRSGEL